jgi:hypothetical protein
MSVAPFRSTTPVSARIDRAWERGYQAGQDDALRHLGVDLIATACRRWRAAGIPLALVALAALALAVYLVPVVAALAVCHYVVAHQRPPAPTVVELPDGSVF